MKKVLSKTAAFVCAVIIFAMNAMPASAAAPSKAVVKNDIQKTAAALIASFDSDSPITYADDFDMLYIAMSGADCANVLNDYLSSVKAHLDENGGKMMETDYTTSTQKESIRYYITTAAVIRTAGLDESSFHGTNLTAKIENFDRQELLAANPYALAVLLKNTSNETLKNEVLETLKAHYKQSASECGYDYWGISVDNNGVFISALAGFMEADSAVNDQIQNTLAWNLTQKSNTGFAGNLNTEYSQTYNANSTAMALLAFAASGDMQNAAESYNLLMTYALDDGSFYWSSDDIDANPFATRDALHALIVYAAALPDDEENSTAASTTSEATSSAVNTSLVSPKTGGQSPAFTALAAALVGVLLISSNRKTHKECAK